MDKSAQIVERAAELCGSKTALAKELDVSLNQVSDWIHERKKVPDSALAICAAIDGHDPLEVLAKTRGGRWEKVAKLAAGAALSVLLTGMTPPTNASPATEFDSGSMYIMSNPMAVIARLISSLCLALLHTNLVSIQRLYVELRSAQTISLRTSF